MNAASGTSIVTAGWIFDGGGSSPFAQRLQPLDRIAEQLHVQVEADGADVAALLGAEQVAGAADLEVAQRDLEAGAQLRRLEDRLQPLLRDLAQRPVLLVQQVGVGARGAAADAAAQLVELRQAEPVGVVDDDRVRVRDVEPRFDDRRADEDVGLAGVKSTITRSSWSSGICPWPMQDLAPPARCRAARAAISSMLCTRLCTK